MMNKQNKISFLDAKNKIEAWCAYRDRCHSEVYEKLKGFGLDDEDTNALIAHLIEYDFLNEQRFADSFVSGRFRIKKWGKNKIIAHLKQKNIPKVCIESALKTINEEEYLHHLESLAQKKWEASKGTPFEKKVKTQRYLISKGYEYDLVYETLHALEKNE